MHTLDGYLAPFSDKAYTVKHTSQLQDYCLLAEDAPRPDIALSVDGVVVANWTLIEGQSFSATLTCSTLDANPAASATWWSKNDLVFHRDDIFIFDSVRRTDAARYTCTAQNTLAPSGETSRNATGSASAVLQVLCE